MIRPRIRPLALAAAALLLAAAPLAAQAAEDLRSAARSAYARRDFAAAADHYLRLSAMPQATATDLYDAACSAALSGRPDEALALLRRALAAGFDGYDLLLARDPDLASLRTLAGWEAVADEARARAAARDERMASLPAPPRVFADLPRAGYLATWLALEEMAAAHADAPVQWRGLLDEIRGWTRAMVGDPAGALALEPARAAPRRDPPDGFDALVPEPAVPAILRAAQGRRVVMVNEAHHVPQGRVLTLELLRGLYDQGFRYLAVEAVGLGAGEALAAAGHPTLATGTYTREPVFGDLLRQAVGMGWAVVPYDAYPVGCRPTPDDPNRCGTLRDSMAAEAIAAATFDRDPDARVLVHAGYSHVVKVPRPGGTQWLGAWLARRGLDPLSVDQTEMRERGSPEAEPAEFARADALGWLAGGPVVLRTADGGWYRSAAEGFGSVDMQVFTPRAGVVAGRADWLFGRAGRRAVPLAGLLPAPLPDGGGPFLVQAFVAGEPEDAVPHDQVVVRGGTTPALALRPGRYRIVVIGRAGEVARGAAAVP